LIQEWLTQNRETFQAKPFFNANEILKSRYYNSDHLVTVMVQDGEWMGANGLARLLLLHAMALIDH